MPTPPYAATISVAQTTLIADEGDDVPLSRGDSVTIEGYPAGAFVPASVDRGGNTTYGTLPANTYQPPSSGGSGGASAMSAAKSKTLKMKPASTPKSFWGKMKTVRAGVPGKIGSTVSGQEVSFEFDSLRLEFAAADKDLADSVTVGFRVPVSPPSDHPFLGYTQDIRLNVTKSPRARALIIADFAGTPMVLEFPANEPVLQAGGNRGIAEGDAPESMDITRTVFSLAARAAEQQYGDPALFPAVAPYQATLTISIRRGRVEETASVTIDSLDVRAIIET